MRSMKNKMNRINKRGDIPITILVIGILAVCILAILSFFTSNNSVKRSFSVIDTVMESGIIKEKISFYSNLGYDKEQIRTMLNLQEDSQGNLVISQSGVTVRFSWP